MIEIDKLDSLEEIRELKKLYISRTTAPLDGMWLCGFVPTASHYGIYEQGTLLGYYCVNENGFLLQYITKRQSRMAEIFELLLQKNHPLTESISGAFCSTAEPEFFSLCLEHFELHTVHALMYQEDLQNSSDVARIELELLQEKDLDRVVSFTHQAIGAPTQWLKGYYSNLITKKELYGHLIGGNIVATGECRGFDEHQLAHADLGVIVGKEMRTKGIATRVISRLKGIAKSKNLKPICSTELGNSSAQKAISRAGFYAANRIVKFSTRS